VIAARTFNQTAPTHHANPLRPWLYRHVGETLAVAGVQLDGPHRWDPQIHRLRALGRLLTRGTLGAGEAYVDGDWDCDAPDELTARLLSANVDRGWASTALVELGGGLLAGLFNLQTRVRARRDIRAHYDAGNDLYTAMLGRTMAYSCGYWRDATTLDDAQDAKHDLICRKLGLERGMRVLDIGCGWGAFAKFAAERYGAKVVGITISPAQAALARHRCAGLPVEIREQDYRDVTGRFDRIVSVGMLEHVGPYNYDAFFAAVSQLLAPSALFLLHSIGSNTSEHMSDPWINRYVFPHSVLPSAAQLTRAFEGRFILEDWHNFGTDYDRTLLSWDANVEAAWPTLGSRYSGRFQRTWRYYLLVCAGAFRARRNQLWQLVLSPSGVPGGYRREEPWVRSSPAS
jgi:cyclopropane-fatty-acyl-phospholipid synthase